MNSTHLGERIVLTTLGAIHKPGWSRVTSYLRLGFPPLWGRPIPDHATCVVSYSLEHAPQSLSAVELSVQLFPQSSE